MSRAAAAAAILRALPCLALATVSGDALAGDDWRETIAAAARKSVVAVLPVLPRHEIDQQEPEGTGFAVGDGRTILTADHVLGRANSVRLRDPDGTVSDAAITLRDAETDIAVLRSAEPFPALALQGAASAGAEVCVLGNAFGLGMSLACGVVSATGRRGAGFNRIEDFVQTDAAINPGMSGAPLLDTDGNVVGMASAIFTKQSDGNLGVNFAASVRLIEAVLDDGSDGRIDRRDQGVILRARPLPGETGKAGGEVVRVSPGSPEERAGITEGDRVLAIGDIAVRGQADYLAALALLARHGVLAFVIERGGATLTIEIPQQGKEQPDE